MNMSVSGNAAREQSRPEASNEKESKLMISSDFVVPRYSIKVQHKIEPEVDRHEEQ